MLEKHFPAGFMCIIVCVLRILLACLDAIPNSKTRGNYQDIHENLIKILIESRTIFFAHSLLNDSQMFYCGLSSLLDKIAS